MISAEEIMAKRAADAQDQLEIKISGKQAQEILDFLGTCPAAQVYHLIGYILTASQLASMYAMQDDAPGDIPGDDQDS